MKSTQDVLDMITPDVYDKFKRAVETRKWANGTALTQDQLATCMRAMIVYESQHLPPEQRTGYMPPQASSCASDAKPSAQETPVKWQ